MTAALKLNSPSPDELWEMDRAHTLHPWTNFGPFEKDGSLIMARGEGCYLWDAEGRKYFDAVGGMWELAPEGADDVFLTALLGQIEADFCVDLDRVHAAGISLGATRRTISSSRGTCAAASAASKRSVGECV